VAGGGFLGSWVGYVLGSIVTGSKVLGGPYAYVGALTGATIGHFVIK